ncbi:hypothetical protein [Marinobacter algicola]|uniref:Uncharacterized protein n=1 Tax=Marinobacter algicola DG893 TaxID=443152 RepID=A6F4T1_9GAMM|nr:hypothetical protein [Marinobacter algicola]EDM46245.1 hypothetical protein MDG893_05064 [Marinobacter algicola DG893]
MSQPQIQMPRACDSCEHYKPVGWDEDKHCPFKGQSASSPKPTRTPFGQCDLHGTEVFATEICNSHEPEPFVHLVDVTNRPEPRTAIQERLL